MSVQIKYYNGDNVSDVDYGDCAVFGSSAGWQLTQPATWPTTTDYPSVADWVEGDLILVTLVMLTGVSGIGSLPVSPPGWSPVGAAERICANGRMLKACSYWRIRAATDDPSIYNFVGVADANVAFVGQTAAIFGKASSVVQRAVATEIITVGSPYYPIDGETLIPRYYTKAGNAAVINFHARQVDPLASMCPGPYRTLYSGGEPYVVPGSDTVLSTLYSVDSASPGGQWVAFGQRFDVIAKKGAGLFGGRLF